MLSRKNSDPTDQARHARAKELFNEAIGQPADRRDRWLLDHCDDAELREHVRALLKAHEDAGTSDPINRLLVRKDTNDSLEGARIGAWQLVERIGAGGMGVVYRAERTGGQFEQTAAVKLVKRGMDTVTVLQRFQNERRVLASLQHPHIARLYDGGVTEEGTPWFAMEYVEGAPITDYCNAKNLSIDERLELFVKVCRAMQHAHNQLVIHRDLKPSNILVTDNGEPHLLDFGLAKVLQDPTGDPTTTRPEHRWMTLDYASPEQVMGEVIGTRSDTYQLGLILYEMLTGRRPYTVSGLSATEAERVICEADPPKPSTAVVSRDGVATASLQPDRLRRRLKGDLDNILLKALHKDPTRGYTTAEALAEDIERYLGGLPIHARPDTFGYRAQKFIRRNRWVVAAAAAIVLSLLGALGVSLWQVGQVRAERDRTQQVNEFLQTILIEADPYEAGADATIRDVLHTAGEMIAERFADEPDLEAALRYTIGNTQLSLMELDSAEANLLRADALNHSLYGPEDTRSLRSRAYLAWLAYARGDYEAAESGYRHVLDRLGLHHPWDFRATVMNDFSIILSDQVRYREAAEYAEQALTLTLENDPDHRDVVTFLVNIGYAWHGLWEEEGEEQQHRRAEQYYRRALEILRERHPDGEHPDVAYNLNNLAFLLRDAGRREEALPLFEESLNIRRATLGTDHPATANGHLNLGRILLEMERLEEARPHLQAALDVSRSSLGEDHARTLMARASVARLAFLEGNRSAATVELAAVLNAMHETQAPSGYIERVDAWLTDARRAINE